MMSADEVYRWRAAQRDDLTARRLAIAATRHRAWSAAITRNLLDGFVLLEQSVIGFFWPFRGEFDPRFAIRHWRERGAAVALPVVLGKGMPLQFRQWWPGAPVLKGVYGLPVPQGTTVLIPQALLIPPLGFDAQGYRLGYGGGYFDRTLAAMDPQPLKIGVAFESARIPTIHPQPHDIPMDFIVTETGVHRVSARGLVPLADAREAAAHAARILRERAGRFSSSARPPS